MTLEQAERWADLLAKRDRLDQASARATALRYSRKLKDASRLLSGELSKLQKEIGLD